MIEISVKDYCAFVLFESGS